MSLLLQVVMVCFLPLGDVLCHSFAGLVDEKHVRRCCAMSLHDCTRIAAWMLLSVLCELCTDI